MHNTKLSNNIKITFLALLGYFTFCSMDSMAKHLVETLEVTQVVWGRFFFHFVAFRRTLESFCSFPCQGLQTDRLLKKWGFSLSF